MATEYVIFKMDVEILAENGHSWVNINNAEDLRACEAYGGCKGIMTVSNKERLDGALESLRSINETGVSCYGFIKNNTGEQ